jgi:RimJ/RimL family protein N-acetyltransferase
MAFELRLHEPKKPTHLRPFASKRDYECMVEYFLAADDTFLRGMGVDPNNLPARDAWLSKLLPDLQRDDREKETYYLAWVYEGEPVGHSNINKIKFAEEAYMHLHMWRPELRGAGLGTEFLKQSAHMFIEKFRLKRLLCEPWVENTAPNRALVKAGFRFVRTYRTVPGPISPEQDVNRYELVIKS